MADTLICTCNLRNNHVFSTKYVLISVKEKQSWGRWDTHMLLLILRCLLKCLQTSKPPPAAAKSTRFSTVHSHPASRSRSFHKFTLQMWPHQPCVKLMSASRAATPSWYCRLMSDIIATTEVHVSARTQVWAFFQSCCDTTSKTGGLGEWWEEWVNCSIFWCTTHQSKTDLQGGLIERLHIHPATDSTETAEFMKFTMTRGAAKPETWCCTKTAAWGCYIYTPDFQILYSPQEKGGYERREIKSDLL